MKKFIFLMILAIGVMVTIASNSNHVNISPPIAYNYDVGCADLITNISFISNENVVTSIKEVYLISINEACDISHQFIPYDYGLIYSYNQTIANNLNKLTMSKITESELNALKAKYKHIKIAKVIVVPAVLDDKGNVTKEEESYEFAIRRPDRSHISMLMPLAEKKEIGEFADKAVKNLVVGGDIDALEDGLVYMGVVAQLKDVIQPYQSFLTTA